MNTKLKLQITHFDGGSLTARENVIKVVGLLKAGTIYDQMLIMPLNDVITMNEWITGIKYDPKKFKYDQVTVRVQDRRMTNDVAQAIQKLGFATDSIGDLLNQLNSFFRTMQLILGGVGLIALLVAASGVANTMMMATRERTREIGVMKAIGATDQDILTIFLLEAALIGLLGGVGGVGVSLLLQNVINQGIRNLSSGGSGASLTIINLSNMSNPVIIPVNLALLAIGLATVVCIAAGLYPAFYAARLSPVIALKQE
jgi:putative ABC transport system permease protein